ADASFVICPYVGILKMIIATMFMWRMPSLGEGLTATASPACRCTTRIATAIDRAFPGQRAPYGAPRRSPLPLGRQCERGRGSAGCGGSDTRVPDGTTGTSGSLQERHQE